MPYGLVRVVLCGLSWVFVLPLGGWVVCPWVVSLGLLVLVVFSLLPLASNARHQARREAEAERKLYAVA
jgi:hypothetical protein